MFFKIEDLKGVPEIDAMTGTRWEDELARAVNEIRPRVFLGENVKGLYEHDGGRTLHTIRNVIRELGHTLIEPEVMRALRCDVPQKLPVNS